VRPLPAHNSRRTITTAAVATGAVAAVVAGVLLLMTAGAGDPGPNYEATATTTSASATGTDVSPQVVARQDQASLVSLTVARPSGTGHSCAVAVAVGGLVATTADAVTGATAVMATDAAGKTERAKVVGVDRTSDIALLQLPVDLPVPHFTDSSQVQPGKQVMVMWLDQASRAERAAWSTDTVAAVGYPVVASGATAMATIDTAATTDFDGGAVMVGPNGSVLGIFDQSGMVNGQAGAAFLPSDLVLGVTGQLASTGRVAHGWLDVVGTDALPPVAGVTTTVGQTTGPVGALVQQVASTGPASSHLQPGDVILAVNGQPVRSIAELRSRLYVLSAGTPVRLSVERAGAHVTVVLDLSASP